MVHTCVEVRIQNMQKFYAISLTNGRPDLTTENHWIKKIYWTHLSWLNKNIYFHTKKTPFAYKKFLNRSIFWLNMNIFSLNDEVLTKQNFFWLNKNMYSSLDKKILNIKMYFCNISATIIITMKILNELKNEIKQNNGNKTWYICHINAQNTAYLISYLVFRFEHLKYVQNLSLRIPRTQELNYIWNW